jgi:hypothetical protein
METDEHEPSVPAVSKVTTLASTSAVTGATNDVVAVHTSQGWPRPRAHRPSRTASQKVE